MQTSNLLVTCVCRTSNRGGPWPAFCFLSSYSVMTCPSQIPCPHLTIACRERVNRQEVQINNASSVSVTAPRRGALEKPLLHPGLMQMKRCWHLLFFHCVDCLLGWRSGRGEVLAGRGIFRLLEDYKLWQPEGRLWRIIFRDGHQLFLLSFHVHTTSPSERWSLFLHLPDPGMSL